MSREIPQNLPPTNQEIHEVRRELDAKIDQKLPSGTFWTVVGIAAIIIGSLFTWLLTVNNSLTTLQTKFDDSQKPPFNLQNPK